MHICEYCWGAQSSVIYHLAAATIVEVGAPAFAVPWSHCVAGGVCGHSLQIKQTNMRIISPITLADAPESISLHTSVILPLMTPQSLFCETHGNNIHSKLRNFTLVATKVHMLLRSSVVLTWMHDIRE